MLNLTSNQGNANENNKTPFYPHLTNKISESENIEWWCNYGETTL